QLPTIKLLKLELLTISHQTLATYNLSWIFPNVQLIRVYLHYCGVICTICNLKKSIVEAGFDSDAHRDAFEAKMIECQKKLFAPVALCPRLHTFLVSNSLVKDLPIDLSHFRD